RAVRRRCDVAATRLQQTMRRCCNKRCRKEQKRYRTKKMSQKKRDVAKEKARRSRAFTKIMQPMQSYIANFVRLRILFRRKLCYVASFAIWCDRRETFRLALFL